MEQVQMLDTDRGGIRLSCTARSVCRSLTSPLAYSPICITSKERMPLRTEHYRNEIESMQNPRNKHPAQLGLGPGSILYPLSS